MKQGNPVIHIPDNQGGVFLSATGGIATIIPVAIPPAAETRLVKVADLRLYDSRKDGCIMCRMTKEEMRKRFPLPEGITEEDAEREVLKNAKKDWSAEPPAARRMGICVDCAKRLHNFDRYVGTVYGRCNCAASWGQSLICTCLARRAQPGPTIPDWLKGPSRG